MLRHSVAFVPTALQSRDQSTMQRDDLSLRVNEYYITDTAWITVILLLHHPRI